MALNPTKSTEFRIGDRLRRYLSFAGISIKDFAVRTGIPYRTLQDYLADKGRPRADHLARMGKAGLDLNWLLLGLTRKYLVQEQPDGHSSDAIITDLDVYKALDDIVLDLADGYAKRYFDRTRLGLSARQVLQVIEYFSYFITRAAVAAAPHIEILRKRGLSVGDILSTILVPSYSGELDPKVDQIIGKASLNDNPSSEPPT